MGDFFQEHRRFLTLVAVGGLVFLIARFVISSIFEGQIRTNQNAVAKAQSDINKAPSSSINLGELKKGRDAAKTAFDEIARSLQRVPDEGFILKPEISDPDLHYNRMVDSVRRKQVEQCAIRNIDVDLDLGLPDAFPTTRRDFDWYLKGLDVVRQVLDLVLKIDAEVLEGGVARVDRIEIAAAPKQRTQASVGPAFLQKHTVEFVLVGHPRSISALLDVLAKRETPGQALIVETSTLRSLDLPPATASIRGTKAGDPLDRGRAELKLVVSAAEIHAQGKLERVGGKAP